MSLPQPGEPFGVEDAELNLKVAEMERELARRSERIFDVAALPLPIRQPPWSYGGKVEVDKAALARDLEAMQIGNSRWMVTVTYSTDQHQEVTPDHVVEER